MMCKAQDTDERGMQRTGNTGEYNKAQSTNGTQQLPVGQGIEGPMCLSVLSDGSLALFKLRAQRACRPYKGV